jgi:UDP-N-acetylmuramyl tripeptide synthase
MKTIIILITKILYKIGKLINKGSSMPGKIALKLCPKILTKVKLPKEIIMVTGSNGKTSTTELIYNILTQNGYNVGCNLEGSNQTEGVATMILNNCSLGGVVRKDALVIESDERYLRHTLKHFKPTYLVITNLYRDQMTRNGNPEHIYNIIKEAGLDDIHLVLNTDDPLSSLYGYKRDNDTYFGINKCEASSEEFSGVYNDGVYCPNCKHKMTYSYYNFAHLGGYLCSNCGHERKNPDFAVTSVDLINGKVKINNELEINLSLRSFYFVYNILSAYAVASLLGIEKRKIANSLSDYVMKNDRVQKFNINGAEGMLLTSKHENSIAYNQSIDYIVKENKSCMVVVIVDQISRKYYTSETSWIWDINFEKLNADCVTKVVLAGVYVHDLISRFKYSDCDESKVVSFENLDDMMKYVKENAKENIYLVTCFTDRNKFLDRI